MRLRLHHTLFVLALASPAGAQEAKPAPDHSSHGSADKPKLDAELTEHFKGIDLTDEQVKRISGIKEHHHKAMDAVKKEAKDSADAETKAKLQRHMDAEHAEFKALLTAEQWKVFEENMKAHHAAGHPAKEGMDHGAMKHEPKAEPKKPR